MKTNLISFKYLHLRVSAGLILLIALTYGFSPQNIVPGWAEFTADRVDLPSIFKALMGMYLSMALVWVISTLRPQFWYGATLLNIFFTLGLAVGRLISLALDGIPSATMLVGLGVEVALGVWGILSLRRYGGQPPAEQATKAAGFQRRAGLGHRLGRG